MFMSKIKIPLEAQYEWNLEDVKKLIKKYSETNNEEEE